MVIREIGSDRLCKITNESFSVIPLADEFFPDNETYKLFLFEGAQHRFYCKARKACQAFYDSGRGFNKIEFNGTQATVFLYKKWAMSTDYQLLPITIEWNKRMSIKKIREALEAAGALTKEFEVANETRLAASP